MRFLLSLLIWAVFVGGLWLYTHQRDLARATAVATQVTIDDVVKEYTLEITSTFSVEPDPFSLNLDDSSNSALQVMVNGEDLEVDSDGIRRGISLTIARVGHLVIGSNEVFLKASPPLTESNMDHGIRVKLLQNEAVILDETIWGEQGSPVSGTFFFQLDESTGVGHDH